MVKVICFILTIVGGINWLTIGMLQYDFVAGMFGTQANIFSRLIYAIIGISAIYTLITTVFNRGKLSVKPAKKSNDQN